MPLKSIRYFIFGFLLLLMGSISTAYAQVDTTGVDSDSLYRPSTEIVVMARASLDSVVLRFAPDNAAGWVKTRQTGFHVERAQVDTLTEFDSTSVVRLTEEPIRPWSLERWEQEIDDDEEMAMMAAEALYGERFVVEPMQTDNPIEALRNASDELNNRFGFALLAADNSVKAAEGLGLRYVDRNVEEGATYVYNVYPAEEDSTFSIRYGTAVVDIVPQSAELPPRNLEATPGDGEILLSWEELPDESYSGYYIYRSSNDGETFEQLNEIPHFFLTGEQPGGESVVQYVDTAAVNYREYVYRVRGINPFAELSEPAEVTAMARDMIPPPSPNIDTPEELGPSAFEITWSFPDTVADIDGFYVNRGDYHEFESSRPLFEDPLPPGTRSYVDSTATTEEPWYFVVAVDSAGNASRSFGVYGELIDRIPPSKPTGLQGEIDTTGTVNLKWDLGPEEDIQGYRLLYANDPTHEFSTVTSMIVRDTAYTDTIAVKTLTKSIYYKVAALDERYNQSEFSEVLKLERPDLVPPEPSVFSDVVVSDSAVSLRWHLSTSEDLSRQVLYRRQDMPEAEWDSLAGLSRTAGSYLDTAVVQNTRYRYRIQAVDSAGLRSDFASTVQARPYDSGIRPAPELVSASYDTTRQQVILEWDYQPPKQEPYYFVLYRSLEGNTPTTYKAIKAEELRYEDRAVVKGEVYQYGIKVKSQNGAESKLSGIRRVSIQR